MTPKVTEAYREATRNEIVRAAEKVFARKGYTAATMDDIVKESGLSKGALYGYFDSKEELFLAMRERLGEFNLDKIVAAMPADSTAAEKLMKVGEVAIESQARIGRSTLQVGFEFWTSTPRIKTLLHYNVDRYNKQHEFLVGLIREGIAKGEFRQDIDPENLAFVLMATVDGLGLHWAMLGIEFEWGTVERNFISMVMKGILTQSKRSGRA